MPKKQYTSVPTNYAVCIHTDCPMAKGCLHQIAYQQLLPERTFMRLVNPQKCEKSAQCPFFRDSTPQKYAKGFTKFQKRMFPEQYEKFSKLLIAEFGRNPYYERRRGNTTLSPKEQLLVIDTLRKVGVNVPMEFDDYVETINWYD